MNKLFLSALLVTAAPFLMAQSCVPTPPPGGGGGGSTCTGRPGAPGSSEREIVVGGKSRSFVLHVPPNLDPNRPVPLVIVAHGFTMSGSVMQELTLLDAVADREGFVVAYVDGDGSVPWNVGSGVCGAGNFINGQNNNNDFDFMNALIEDVAADQCLDRDAIFFTGFSMGGYLANHIGCQVGTSVFRAVAPHSGGTYDETECPAGPVPIMIVHGDDDWLIAPRCGDDAAALWVERNGCSTTYTRRVVDEGECRWYDGCPADGQVVYCVFDGMSHGWAGADQDGAHGFYAGGTQYENASDMIWSFFEDQL